MKSEKLFNLMIEKGYPNGFTEIISRELHTEFTANRMIGYISAREMLPMEEVADEMLAILSDRDRLIRKHISQDAQAAINEFYRLPEESDDEEEEINDYYRLDDESDDE